MCEERTEHIWTPISINLFDKHLNTTPCSDIQKLNKKIKNLQQKALPILLQKSVKQRMFRMFLYDVAFSFKDITAITRPYNYRGSSHTFGS